MICPCKGYITNVYSYLIIIYHLLAVWIDDQDMGNEPWDPDADFTNSTEKYSCRQVSENNQKTCHRQGITVAAEVSEEK